jgi:PAS domain S-box-containing protein
MLGYSEEEMLGRTPLDFVDQPYRHIMEARLVPQPVPAQAAYEVALVRKDGRRIAAAYNATAVMSAQGEREFSFAFITDVTQRKRLEEELLDTLAREKELSEVKSRFVSMTSHEFRTPLAAILSSAELLADYGDRLPPEEKQELTGMIKSSVLRMSHMLDDILLIGRADAGRLQFAPQPLDLRALCAQIVDEVRVVSQGQQLIFRYRGDERDFNVDERLLRHILTNLLGNAAKYSQVGGLVELTATCIDSEVQLEVADQGMGIPPEDQPSLFQTFHRGSNVGHIPGTGLGLAIVKKAVDLHGGTISLDTEVSKGTRFTVTLPEARGSNSDKISSSKTRRRSGLTSCASSSWKAST